MGGINWGYIKISITWLPRWIGMNRRSKFEIFTEIGGGNSLRDTGKQNRVSVIQWYHLSFISKLRDLNRGSQRDFGSEKDIVLHDCFFLDNK